MVYKRIAIREDIYEELKKFRLYVSHIENTSISLSDAIGWLLLKNRGYLLFK
jgi:predicted CopG family antitoxin